MKIRVWIHQKQSGNFGLVWSPRDVIALRRDHRIIGNLIGCPPKTPRQVGFSGLPLVLQPEEITALVREGAVDTVTSSPECNNDDDNIERIAEFERFREDSYKQQVQVCRDDRAAQIRQMTDKIVQGKKRKRSNKTTAASAADNNKPVVVDEQEKSKKRKDNAEETEEVVVVDPEEEELQAEQIIQKELEKIQDFPPQNLLIQTFNEDPWTKQNTGVPFHWKLPESHLEKVKSLTFDELRNRGFYITSGDKFGADFLAYPGDPLLFHAKFVILCLKNAAEIDRMQESSLVAKCRLGTAVNKNVLVAYTTASGAGGADRISFKRLKWTAALDQ